MAHVRVSIVPMSLPEDLTERRSEKTPLRCYARDPGHLHLDPASHTAACGIHGSADSQPHSTGLCFCLIVLPRNWISLFREN